MMIKYCYFLLVLTLLSACSSIKGQAASNPVHTPVIASASPSNTAAVLTPSATPSRTPLPPTTTASTANGSSSIVTISPRPSFTPFPSASPTALPQPTRAVKVEPSPTPGGPPTATPEPGESLLDQYLPRREKVAESEHFIFYAQDGYFPVDQSWWASQSEEVYAYVSQRLDRAQVKNKIHLAFQPPNKETCPVRGLASQGDAPMVIVFADRSSPKSYLLAVLAHEVAHAISYEGFPEGLPDNIALAEGIATWGSGKYWTAWKNVSGLDDLVRGYLADGSYEAIHENTDFQGIYPWQKNAGRDCLARRDRLYSEWASFTGYLIDTFGWQKAHQLFHRPDPIKLPGLTIEFPPDYKGVYGKELNQLEWEWLEKIVNS